jgi:hypothetical protein
MSKSVVANKSKPSAKPKLSKCKEDNKLEQIGKTQIKRTLKTSSKTEEKIRKNIELEKLLDQIEKESKQNFPTELDDKEKSVDKSVEDLDNETELNDDHDSLDTSEEDNERESLDSYKERESKTIEDIMNNSEYSDDEIKEIISNENRKLLTEKIKKSLQKPEWIEILRIIKTSESKGYQENNNGIWIVMNKLQNETIIKLHKFVEYCMKCKNNLEFEKILRNKIKQKIKSKNINIDENFIKDSQLLNDNENENQPSGFSESFNGVTQIGNDGDMNLKEHIDAEKSKLTDSELELLLHHRMMTRDRDDENFMTLS